MNKGTRQLILGLIYFGVAIIIIGDSIKSYEKSGYFYAVLEFLIGLLLIDNSISLTQKSTK